MMEPELAAPTVGSQLCDYLLMVVMSHPASVLYGGQLSTAVMDQQDRLPQAFVVPFV